MIPYHGTPITPESAAIRALRHRHGFVSHANPQQVGVVAAVCRSFALDNGAFTEWKHGRGFDEAAYEKWAANWMAHPGCDWALIPDVIDGTAEQNDEMIRRWPLSPAMSVPVWHLHEPVERLASLCSTFARVALGSSGAYREIGTPSWWRRMDEAMRAACDDSGRPRAKIHGLRMLDEDVVERFPFSSADSTNLARNVGIDSRWRGTYTPPSRESRAVLLAERIEAAVPPPTYEFAKQGDLAIEISEH